MLLNLTHTHTELSPYWLRLTDICLPGRVGAHQRQGELRRGSSCPTRPSCRISPKQALQETPGERERRRAVAPSSPLLPALPPSPVGDWTCVCLLQPTYPPPKHRPPSPFKGMHNMHCTLWLAWTLFNRWVNVTPWVSSSRLRCTFACGDVNSWGRGGG